MVKKGVSKGEVGGRWAWRSKDIAKRQSWQMSHFIACTFAVSWSPQKGKTHGRALDKFRENGKGCIRGSIVYAQIWSEQQNSRENMVANGKVSAECIAFSDLRNCSFWVRNYELKLRNEIEFETKLRF